MAGPAAAEEIVATRISFLQTGYDVKYYTDLHASNQRSPQTIPTRSAAATTSRPFAGTAAGTLAESAF